jgi:hypothetical protein
MNDLNQSSLNKHVKKSSKATPRKTLIIFTVITVIILTISTLIATSEDKTLSEFSLYDGRLTEIKVTTTRSDMNRPASPILVFTLDGLEEKLAIEQNQPVDFSPYTSNLHVGDKVRVYYDAHPYRTPEGFNPYVMQLEKGDLILLDLNDENKSYKRGGYIGLGLGLLALIGTIMYYKNNVANIAKENARAGM